MRFLTREEPLDCHLDHTSDAAKPLEWQDGHTLTIGPGFGLKAGDYRGTSLMRNNPLLGPYSRTRFRAIRGP